MMLRAFIMFCVCGAALASRGQTFIPFLGTSAGGGNGLLNNLIWYAEFDQASGDETSYGATTCCGGVSWVQLGGSLSSVSGVINTARSYAANKEFWLDTSPGTGDFSITGWVKLSSITGNQTIFASWDDGHGSTSQGTLLRFIDTGTDTFTLTSRDSGGTLQSVSVSPAAPIATGSWYFICAGYDSGAGNLFITCAIDGGSLPARQTTAITGRLNVTVIESFGGRVDDSGVLVASATEQISSGSATDEWGFWNRVLTTGDQALLFAKTAFGSFTH